MFVSCRLLHGGPYTRVATWYSAHTEDSWTSKVGATGTAVAEADAAGLGSGSGSGNPVKYDAKSYASQSTARHCRAAKRTVCRIQTLEVWR